MAKSSLICPLLLVLAVNPATLLAEEDLDYLFALSLEELLKVKVIGSTLTPKDIKTVPSAVTVFTQREIMNLGLDSLDELINLVPGFQSYRTPLAALNYTYSSRGRSISGVGTEILILVDGIRITQPRDSGGIYAAPKYPLTLIERIEFIRGPGSAIYGSNAMMGVINIITLSQVKQASISYGSFNRRKANLQASGRIGDATLDLLADIDKDEGDDYKVQDSFSANRIATQDPREIIYLNFKLHWHNTQLNLQHNQSRDEDFYQISNVSNGVNKRAADFTAISLQQNFEWQGVDSWFSLGFSRGEENVHVQLAAPGVFTGNSSPDSNDAWFAIADLDDSNETRLQWHNDWAIKAQRSLQFGIEYRHIDAPEAISKSNFDQGDVNSTITPIRYYGSSFVDIPVQLASKRDIVGVYGQYQHQLFDNTQLTLGLRYDEFSTIGSHLSPRFALVHALNVHHSLKLLYGEAFRVPTEAELNLVNNPVVLGNPELVPETVQTGELIWLAQWSNTVIHLGYFDSRFKDAIVRELSGATLVYVNKNEDPSKGFEFELTQQLNEHWLGRGTYTHFSETPASSFREANQLASFMVNFKQANWNANLVASYHGDRDMPVLDSRGKRISLDGYWVFSGKLQYQFNSQWQAFMQVKNFSDKAYLTPVTGDNPVEGTPNRGREIQAGMVWKF